MATFGGAFGVAVAAALAVYSATSTAIPSQDIDPQRAEVAKSMSVGGNSDEQLRFPFGGWGASRIDSVPLQNIQYLGTDACAGDELGGRCPGETITQCIIRCNKHQDDLEEGCSLAESAYQRAVCYGQAALEGGQCRAQCKK